MKKNINIKNYFFSKIKKGDIIKTISQTSFKHGWYYHYRIHNHKLEKLTKNFENLKLYLKSVFNNCPEEYFNTGPRSSSLKFFLPLKPNHDKSNNICNFAKYGLKINENRYKSNHSKVQMFMLENDKKSIAIEVPLWIHESELADHNIFFKTSGPLTGHIDLLRIQDDKIWVWDYKPDALKEKFATTQTYFYALMLSKRTGIPLDNFMCGYFDKHHAFTFKPDSKKILKL